MLTHTRAFRIEWGDCDPAGIVFYPRYFAMFNHASHLLVERAFDMTVQALFGSGRCHGLPLVDTRARFLLPTRFDDDVAIETAVLAVRRSSFDLRHRLSRDGALAVEGFETRVWVLRDAGRPAGFRAHPIPADLAACLTAA